MDIEMIDGFRVEWQDSSTCGKIGIATKKRQKYFCKEFNNHVEPRDDDSMSPALKRRKSAAFQQFVTAKTKLNETLRKMFLPEGTVIYPLYETVYEHHFIEFSRCIKGAIVPNEYSAEIAKLSEDKKLLMLKILVAALGSIHAGNIVHGDLKLTNFLLYRNDKGNLISNLIDFDGAFFATNVPSDSITGTPNYYSPELGYYINETEEDSEEREEFKQYITTKSDIFSLGLIMHEYLAGVGKFPKPSKIPARLRERSEEGGFLYPWEILLYNDEAEEAATLLISEEIKSGQLRELLSAMLSFDPEQRPSATEVLAKLQEIGDTRSLWPEDAELYKLNIAKLDEMKAHFVERVEYEGRRMYRFLINDSESCLQVKSCVQNEFFALR